MAIETVRLTEQNKEQLIRIKRRTKISNWNVLCRWALCLSLKDPTPPPEVHFESWSNVEMSWKVFGGKYSDAYLITLKQRCRSDGFECTSECLTQQLKMHLSRGVNILLNLNFSDLLRCG